MICLGFDPGTTGAGCIIGLPRGPVLFDLPIEEIPGDGDAKVKKRIDVRALYQLLISHLAGQSGVFAVKERLSYGGQRQGNKGFNMVQTTVSQAQTHESLRVVLALLGVEIEEVSPATWKKLFGLQGKADDKKGATDEARLMAARLYGDLAPQLQRVKDHNRAEAILITHWFRREVMRRHELEARSLESEL